MGKARYHRDPAPTLQRLEQVEGSQAAARYQQCIRPLRRLENLDAELEQALTRHLLDVGNVLDSQSANRQNLKAFFLKEGLQTAIDLIVIGGGDRQASATDAPESLGHRRT